MPTRIADASGTGDKAGRSGDSRTGGRHSGAIVISVAAHARHPDLASFRESAFLHAGCDQIWLCFGISPF
jgi:hypothetical protein